MKIDCRFKLASKKDYLFVFALPPLDGSKYPGKSITRHSSSTKLRAISIRSDSPSAAARIEDFTGKEMRDSGNGSTLMFDIIRFDHNPKVTILSVSRNLVNGIGFFFFLTHCEK